MMNPLRSEDPEPVVDDGPITLVPFFEQPSVIAPLLSMKQREVGSSPLVRTSRLQGVLEAHVDPEPRADREIGSFPLVRTARLQGVLETRVDPEPKTDAAQIIGSIYINDKQLLPVDILMGATTQYVRLNGAIPGCLCMSSELQCAVRCDMEYVYGSFDGTFPFPDYQRVVHDIPVHFFSDLSPDCTMGYAQDLS